MTVATNTTTVDTEAPEGYIAINKVLAVALAQGEKRGWCDELKDVLKNELGIEVPERPDNLTVRLTIDIPAEALDYTNGKQFWSTFDLVNGGDVTLDESDYYGVPKAKYAAANALRTLTDRATDSYTSRRGGEAREILNAAKVELIRADEK